KRTIRLRRDTELGSPVVGVPESDTRRAAVEPVPSRQVNDRNRSLAQQLNRLGAHRDAPAEYELAEVLEPNGRKFLVAFVHDDDLAAFSDSGTLLLHVQGQRVRARRIEPTHGCTIRLPARGRYMS